MRKTKRRVSIVRSRMYVAPKVSSSSSKASLSCESGLRERDNWKIKDFKIKGLHLWCLVLKVWLTNDALQYIELITCITVFVIHLRRKRRTRPRPKMMQGKRMKESSTVRCSSSIKNNSVCNCHRGYPILESSKRLKKLLFKPFHRNLFRKSMDIHGNVKSFITGTHLSKISKQHPWQHKMLREHIMWAFYANLKS